MLSVIALGYNSAIDTPDSRSEHLHTCRGLQTTQFGYRYTYDGTLPHLARNPR